RNLHPFPTRRSSDLNIPHCFKNGIQRKTKRSQRTVFHTHMIQYGGYAYNANKNGKLQFIIEPWVDLVVQTVYIKDYSKQECHFRIQFADGVLKPSYFR